MTVRTVTAVRPSDELDDVLAPRDGVVAEHGTDLGGGHHRFEQRDGPLRSYQRDVWIRPAASGSVEIVQEVRLRVGIPGFSWLFALPLAAHTRRVGRIRSGPWWAPPARLSRRAAVVLATLCLLTVVIGYLSDLLADTMTYAGGEFGVGRGGQGVALGVVEAGAVGALILLRVADRHGRRPVLLWTLVAAAVVSAAGAAAPSLYALTVFGLVAASLVGAGFVVVGVVAAEEMPPGCRAWAVGVIGMCFGLGSGLTLVALPLADAGRSGWRGVYVIALLGVPAVAVCARWLPESRRWSEPMAALDRLAPRRRLTPTLRRRLLVLGAGALLFALFASPASQFQNEFLHTERHLSATRISLLEQLSGTIGGLGTLVGGRLADTWGRRPVAAIGVALGAVATIAHYTSSGIGLWVWNTLASVISYGVAPALGVYGAELFPTGQRARAGGVLTVFGAAGGVAGLAAAGALSSLFGSIAPALGVLAVAPLAVVVLILVAYPETAGRTLEDLNDCSEARPGPRLRGKGQPDRQPSAR